MLVNEPDPKKARCGFPRPTARPLVVGGVLVAQWPQPVGRLGELEGVPAQHVVVVAHELGQPGDVFVTDLEAVLAGLSSKRRPYTGC